MAKTKRNFLVIFSALFVVAMLSACAGPTPATEQLPATGVEDSGFDRQFIEMMVPHHQGALEMARVAQERAEHPEVKAMAEDILAVQAGEIDQMLGWMNTWYGTTDTPSLNEVPMLTGMEGMGHGGSTMDMAADVEKLRQAPEPFDLAFIDAMIEHHESAILAAEAAREQATREEIKAMAEAIITGQQQEIDEMRAWRNTWYPDQP